jgi:hypothetical protein
LLNWNFQGGSLLGQLSLNASVTVTVQPEGNKKTGKSGSTEWRFAVEIPERSLIMAAPTKEVACNLIFFALLRLQTYIRNNVTNV